MFTQFLDEALILAISGLSSRSKLTADGTLRLNVSYFKNFFLIANVVAADEEDEQRNREGVNSRMWYGRRRRQAGDPKAEIQAVAEESIENLSSELDVGTANVVSTTDPEVTNLQQSPEPAAKTCETGFELQK